MNADKRGCNHLRPSAPISGLSFSNQAFYPIAWPNFINKVGDHHARILAADEYGETRMRASAFISGWILRLVCKKTDRP